MPPKKKNKPRAAADADSPPPEPVIFDGWTDEQETTLFKAISVYRLKPAGMHKHFRIIGISELMKNHGVSDAHTNIEGIWRKLQSLYNLEGLDEREDLLEDDGSPDPGTDFTLPDDDFGALMTARRLDPRSTDSPMRASTFNFSAAAPRGKKGRAMRSVSADGSRTARTNSIQADDTEDELSMKSASPAPRKTKTISTRGRKPGPFAKSRGGGRGGLKSKLVSSSSSPRRKKPTTTKPVVVSSSKEEKEEEEEEEEASSPSSSSSSSSPSSSDASDSSSEAEVQAQAPKKPEKPEQQRPQQKTPAQKRTAAAAAAAAAAKDKRGGGGGTSQSDDDNDNDDDDDDDDDELSDVPDELDEDDAGTVAETEGTDAAGDDVSEMGESTTAAESPAPTVSSRGGKGSGRGRGGGSGSRGGRGGKRGGKRGGDVRRSTRRK